MKSLLTTVKNPNQRFKIIEEYFKLDVKDQGNINRIIHILLETPKEEYQKFLNYFFELVVKKQLEGLLFEEIRLNPFLIKGSKDEKIYDNYIKRLINININDYHKEVIQIIKSHPKLVDKYIYKNVNQIDYNNDLEVSLVSNFITRKLNVSSKLINKDIKIIVRLLIGLSGNEMSLKIKVNSISIWEYINQKKLKLSLVLKRAQKYLKVYGICLPNTFYDGIIKINTDNFQIQKHCNVIDFNKNKTLFDLISTCFHELQHAKQNNYEKLGDGKELSLYCYQKMKEKIIVDNDRLFYKKNHDQFISEIDADIVGYQKTLSFFEKYLMNRYKKVKNYGLKMLNKRLIDNIFYNEEFINVHLKMILKKDIRLFDKNPLLLLEYNKDGSRKKLREILKYLKQNPQNEELVNHVVVSNLYQFNTLESFYQQLIGIKKDDLILIKNILNSEYLKKTKQEKVLDSFLEEEKNIKKDNMIKDIKFICSMIKEVNKVISVNENKKTR